VHDRARPETFDALKDSGAGKFCPTSGFNKRRK